MSSAMGQSPKPTGNGKSDLGDSIERPGTPRPEIPTLINYNPTHTTYHGIYNNANQGAGHGYIAATAPTQPGYQLTQTNMHSSSYSNCATSGSISPRSGFWDSGCGSMEGEWGSAASSPRTSAGGEQESPRVTLPSFQQGFGELVAWYEEEDRAGIPSFEEAFGGVVRRDVEASFLGRFLPGGRR